MLVEINLLPKRDERNIAIYVISVIILLLLVFIVIGFSIYLNTKKEEFQTIDKQVVLNQKILEEQHQKLIQYQTSKSVVELERAIEWAKDQPFNMVYILQELTKALPQRGFILEFQMNEDNIIAQKVQFDTKSDAAYYLSSILKYSWVSEAVISEAKQTNIDAQSQRQDSTGNNGKTERNILPRYVATYEIKLDIPQLKTASKSQNETADKGEGGTTP